MQSLTQAPRQNLTAAQVKSLITGSQVQITPGLELLDGNNNFVGDISSTLVSGTVERNCLAAIHGTCNLVLEGAVGWGVDRLRPFMVLSNGKISARFNLGVFVIQTPVANLAENPITYSVTGYDLLCFLDVPVGDTYAVTSGTTYFTAIQSIISALNIGSNLYLDGTLQSSTLPNDMVWALTPGSTTTWLDIINDLLGSINYRNLWADENGNFRSTPAVLPSTRAVEWILDTSDNTQNIVAPKRDVTSDVFDAHNWWRFVRTPMTTKPVEGAGIYTVQNTSTGRTSQTALGRTIKAPVQFLTAADQTSLTAQGNAIVAADQRVSRTFTISLDPLPVAGHLDIVQFKDNGSSDICQVDSWVTDLMGKSSQWILEAVNA